MMTACSGGPTSFVHPLADVPYYERVAIIPFTTLSQNRLAGEKVSNVFYNEVLLTGFAEVMEPGQFLSVSNVLRGNTSPTTPWSPADLARLGQEANIQGVFMGIVRDYEMARVGRENFPLLSLEVRLVDTATGNVVWSSSYTRRGGPAMPVFGWGEIHTLGELTTVMCRDILRTLPEG
jgi:TolB-like protein